MKTWAFHIRIGTVCLGAGASLLATAQGKPAQRFPLGADAISRALHKDGLEVRADDVHMPMPLSAAVSNPPLEIVGMDRLPDGHLRLRLRCPHAGDCLPFGVTLVHGVAAPVLLASALTPAPRASAESSVASPQSEMTAASIHVSEAPVAVHAGARLTMLLDDGHMHIHLPVISLGSATGDGSIRVATPDGKQTYRAVVVDATTVRGIIE